MTSWDGKTERRNGGDHHDLLIRIDTNLNNFIKRFDDHEKEDDSKFEKMDRKVSIMERGFYAVGGVIIFIEIIYKFIK